MKRPVVIVGGGLAGLACAVRLHQSGIPFHLLEATDRVGGRLKSDLVDGFRLDRGFQVYFDAYPAAREFLAGAKLNLKPFRPGAILQEERGPSVIDGNRPWTTLHSPAFGILDKALLFRLKLLATGMSQAEIGSYPDVTMERFLEQFGFSPAFLRTFARPFFGSVFLDASLSVSVRQFLFVFKSLSSGRTVIPSQGIEAIPQYLASQVPPSSIQAFAKVTSLLRANERVSGVKLADHSEIEADVVVLATDAPTTAHLLGQTSNRSFRGTTCLYFEAPEPPVKLPYLVLNATGTGNVVHVAPLTQIAPELAPGRHLVSATWLDVPKISDAELNTKTLAEINRWFPNKGVSGYKPIRIYRIPHAQLYQPVGFYNLKYTMNPFEPNLYLAGEASTNSSIDGAFESGARVARRIIWDLNR